MEVDIKIFSFDIKIDHSEGCHQLTLKGFELPVLNFLMTGKRLEKKSEGHFPNDYTFKEM